MLDPRSRRRLSAKAEGALTPVSTARRRETAPALLEFYRLYQHLYGINIFPASDSEVVVIFRQLFDVTSGTYTYLLASRRGGEALIVDPVLEKVDRYLSLIRELDLRLVKAVDTHLHADHITGLGALRDRTNCITVMGENTKADVVSMRLSEGDKLAIEGVSMDVLYTPGHTDDSYSFLMRSEEHTSE